MLALSERLQEIAFALYSDQLRKQCGEEMKEDYRRRYADAKTDGIPGIVRLWCRELWPDLREACNDRAECGEHRQLAMLGLSLALAGLAILYSGFALGAGLLSFALVGIDVHGQLAASANVWEQAQLPVYVANIVPALLFTIVAWGSRRFARNMYNEVITS